MKRLRAWILRLTGIFPNARRERDMADEIESHVQMHTEDNVRAGMNREQAGENAQRNLQLTSLFLRNRQETGIFESGGAGRFGRRTIQRCDGHGIPDASPKVAAETTG